MKTARFPRTRATFLLPLAVLCWTGERAAAAEAATAIVGATLIDGNGGPALPDATIVIAGKRIAAVGPRAAVKLPAGAAVIDGAGKFVTPGFIDTNVHLSLYGGSPGERYETLVKYQPQAAEIALEAAQLHLKHGVTTVRDSYGQLLAVIAAREAIARGQAVGPRVLAAGNIVGWGGPFSVSFSLVRDQGLSLFQEQMNDVISLGSGEELMDMTPEELRVAINKYLDKGPDFLKYGGTSHWSNPTFVGFSPEAQKVIVDETHKRGRVAETHSTSPEGLRLSILAGIDLIQHPEVLTPREMTDELARMIAERKVICSMLVNTITGSAWKKHLKDKAEADRKRAEAQQEAGGGEAESKRPKTLAEIRQQQREQGADIEIRRRNAQKLIQAGAVVTLGTDNYWGSAPEFRRTPKRESQEHGLGTIIAIEGLVELGMTPAQAIVSGTKNGAIASKGLKDFGTLEAGKLADLVVLDADPLQDVTNIRKVNRVIKEGQLVDLGRLPDKPVLSRSVATN